MCREDYTAHDKYDEQRRESNPSGLENLHGASKSILKQRCNALAFLGRKPNDSGLAIVTQNNREPWAGAGTLGSHTM